MEHARYLARHIPGAMLIEFPGQIHSPWHGNRDQLLDAVEQFLTGRRIRDLERLLATVLFVDIVGSTEQQPHSATPAGANCWRRSLPVSARCCSFTVEGDQQCETAFSCLRRPGSAIRCAGAIGEAVRAFGLAVRCEIHTGECEIVGNDLAGIAVHIGARVAAQVPARCWSHKPSGIWLPASGLPSVTVARTISRASRTSGGYSRQLSNDARRYAASSAIDSVDFARWHSSIWSV